LLNNSEKIKMAIAWRKRIKQKVFNCPESELESVPERLVSRTVKKGMAGHLFSRVLHKFRIFNPQAFSWRSLCSKLEK